MGIRNDLKRLRKEMDKLQARRGCVHESLIRLVERHEDAEGNLMRLVDSTTGAELPDYPPVAECEHCPPGRIKFIVVVCPATESGED
jgi:hypothetical protein